MNNSVYAIETLAMIFETHAQLQPEAVAFIEVLEKGCEREITYEDGKWAIEDYAAALIAAGVLKGDRIAIRLPKNVNNILLFFAVTRIGAIYVPINPELTRREAAILLEDSDPALIVDNHEEQLTGPLGVSCKRFRFGTGDADDLLNCGRGELPEMPSPSDGALMLFTSGTTGRPKGALLTHHNLLSNLVVLSKDWEITKEDCLLHVLPVFHGHGLYLGIVMPMLRGASVILLPHFDARKAIELLPRATILMAVPAIWTRFMEQPSFTLAACQNLRLATSGSAPLSPDVFKALHKRIGKKVVERYGMTETCMLTTNPINGEAKVGSVGRPLLCVDLRIVDNDGAGLSTGEVGRVQVRGSSIIKEYWRRPSQNGDWSEGGWFDTGDLGRLDADNFLWLVGRSKDLIISGGYNVYPREVEIEIQLFPGVVEAVVFGVPHPKFGEGVMAAIKVVSPTTFDLEHLSEHVSNTLTKYKQPKRTLIVDEFPRNQLGKVLKTELQKMHQDTFK